MNVYEIVTERITKQIEDALKTGEKLPWEKPWRTGKDGFYNYVTNHEYSGINTLLLDSTCKFYLTWNQIQELKKKNNEICLKKGSKSLIVVFWKRIAIDEQAEDNKTGEKKTVKKVIPYLRYYNVFRACDVENLPEKEMEILVDDKNPIEECETIKGKSVCTIKEISGSNEACYYPGLDYIQMPVIQQFKRTEGYYSTLFHEMIHSTGHESRLARLKKTAAFGNEEYSQEELTAEIGASMLRTQAGIDYEPEQKNTQAYLLSWLKALRNDPKMIVYSAGRALKAVNYIMGTSINSDMAVEEGQ